MSVDAARQRKVFIYLDEEEEVQVSISHEAEKELVAEYNEEFTVRVLAEFPLYDTIRPYERDFGSYYRAVEGVLSALPEMREVCEVIMARMVKEGISIARHLPPPKERIQ